MRVILLVTTFFDVSSDIIQNVWIEFFIKMVVSFFNILVKFQLFSKLNNFWNIFLFDTGKLLLSNYILFLSLFCKLDRLILIL
jgi:hypothetical protein